MAGETPITIVGNVVADPELRYTQNGLPVANLTIASTPRSFDRATNEWKDGDALFLRSSVWREQAEHVAQTLTKGTRVIATGRLVQRNYTDKDNNARSAIELEVDEIGPALRHATAVVTRSAKGAQGGNQAPATAPASAQAPAPAAAQAPVAAAPAAPAPVDDDVQF